MKTAYILIVGMRFDLLLWRIFPGAEWLAKPRLTDRSEMAERSQANFESRKNQTYAYR